MLGTEMLRHLRQGQPAIDVAGVSEAEQMVEHGDTQETPLAKLMRAGTAMTLRQWGAVLPEQQADMPIAGASHAEGLQKHDLARGVGEMIIAAQYLRHAHRGIIHGIAKEERRRAVFTADDEIA